MLTRHLHKKAFLLAVAALLLLCCLLPVAADAAHDNTAPDAPSRPIGWQAAVHAVDGSALPQLPLGKEPHLQDFSPHSATHAMTVPQYGALFDLSHLYAVSHTLPVLLQSNRLQQ
ncbi:hypothetical protein LJC55_03305 [Eubacteriales bacterium OttesenSCG-928-N14]|nr:hypothetical protein [Eubacteriales bacterium OttesenSCG-928-N14]